MIHRASSNRPDGFYGTQTGFVAWIRQCVLDGYTLYYVNFMFDPLEGSRAFVIEKMKKAIIKFYGRFCLQFVHNGRAASEQRRLPRLYLFLDLPVFKYESFSRDHVTFNAGGHHYNGMMLVPPASRFHECPIDHIAQNQFKYALRGISRIDVRSAGPNLPRLVDYSTKSIATGSTSEDDILILPRTTSELPSKRAIEVNPSERLLKDIKSSLNVSDETAWNINEDLIKGNPRLVKEYA